MRTIYTNATILTVNEAFTKANAMVIDKGRITYIGDTEKALTYKTLFSRTVDLHGATVLPGFLDSHSHFLYTALLRYRSVDLSAPPLGDVTTVEDIISRLKAEADTRKEEDNTPILGMGYDDSTLPDQAHPTRYDLDLVSTDKPVAIIHRSAHVGVVNSYLLKQYGIDKDTPHPEGGRIDKDGAGIPTGLLEETAFMDRMMDVLKRPGFFELLNVVKDGQQYYAQYGMTTVQDGAIDDRLDGFYRLLKRLGRLKLDVISYFTVRTDDDLIKLKQQRFDVLTYKKGYRLGGAKMFLDGSPQAKTAWLTKPYKVPPKGKPKDYRGYPVHEDEVALQRKIAEIVKRDLQLLVHTNGDAASDQLIRCYEKAQPLSKRDLRPVMIHAQTVREDQIKRMKPLHMIPSFFELHTYFWGDWHLDSVLGETRGQHISPIGWAIKHKLHYALHSDSPVLPPDNPLMLWAAVNRKTRQGRDIGATHAVDIEEAIRALTIHTAYQYGEEDVKGSLEAGKLADFVVVDRNPLDTPIADLKDLKILQTYKRGKLIYQR